MKQDRAADARPTGGLAASQRSLRKWKWRRAEVSEPVRCRKENWYLLRAHAEGNGQVPDARVGVQFLLEDEPLAGRTVHLARTTSADGASLVGWVQAPPDATHLRVQLFGETPPLEKLVLYPAAERDPKCHPYANPPRWSTYRPPFPLARVYVPAALKHLADFVDGPEIVPLPAPRSTAALDKTITRNGLVLDGQLVRKLGLDYRGLLRLAATSWIVIDLETMAALVRHAGLADARVQRLYSSHDIMSARVEYADVPTRGFALFDVLPYATVAEDGGFATRVLRANKSWKRYADDLGLATLLSSETPWENRCGDVLSAAAAVERGELITTDLPWLVGGPDPLLAPRLARHLLSAHLGGKVEDGIQYWNRWEDGGIVLRDIADLARRYPVISTLRWAGDPAGTVRLGLGLTSGTPQRTILLQTGRADSLAPHDGVPPEPMMILVKWLAREVAEDTAWARRHLADTRILWQFESADGLRQATHFRAAPPVPRDAVRVALRTADIDDALADNGTWLLPRCHGVHGDGSLDLQRELQAILRRVLLRG